MDRCGLAAQLDNQEAVSFGRTRSAEAREALCRRVTRPMRTRQAAAASQACLRARMMSKRNVLRNGVAKRPRCSCCRARRAASPAGPPRIPDYTPQTSRTREVPYRVGAQQGTYACVTCRRRLRSERQRAMVAGIRRREPGRSSRGRCRTPRSSAAGRSKSSDACHRTGTEFHRAAGPRSARRAR